jgi:hypothetical protein
MFRRLTAVLASLAFASALHAQAYTAPAPAAAPPAPSPGDFKRPAYQPLRYNEDWSGLKGKDTASTGDWLDPIKFIPLDEKGDLWLSIGGQVRQRFEVWQNFNFGAQPTGIPDNDEFLLSRFMFHTDLHLGPHVRLFAEMKSALTWDRDLAITGAGSIGPRVLDEDSADIQNAFGELMLPLDGAKLIFRGGRQELLFGNQRLVSPLDWTNTRRTFDGFTGILKIADWTATAFWTRFVPVEKYGFNEQDANTDFYGLHVTGKLPIEEIGVDFYWYGLDSKANAHAGSPFSRFITSVANPVADDERHTVGGRLFGKFGKSGLDYELEGAYQFGDHGTQDISAFMVVGVLGYSFTDTPWAPRVYVGFDYASGDDSTGGDSETFSQLFPLAHAYQGYIDIESRQNVINPNTGLSIKPIPDKLTITLDGHLFWLAEEGDALYNAGGAIVRNGTPGASTHVGAEIDLWFRYNVDRHTAIMGGYSHFFAGDFISDTSSVADDDIDFFYLTFQFTF